MPPHVLWQFTSSHYNEKARWALDYKRVPHIRRSLVPGFHIATVKRLTGQTAVPVLQMNGRVIHDSTRIIAALEESNPDPPLYPHDADERRRALELEDFFDEELGPHIRRAGFYLLLPHRDVVVGMFSQESGPLTRAAFRLSFPLLRIGMRKAMRIDAEGAELGRFKTLAALDRIELEIEPSGYLVGDRFSVADLTAAALLSPLVAPPEFPYPLPKPLPQEMVAFRDSVAGRRAFQWVLDIYRRHRGASAATPSTRVLQDVERLFRSEPAVDGDRSERLPPG
jgi:glutathione S-transferase